MSVKITQDDITEALAEIEALRDARRQMVGWPDELYKFVESALGDSTYRGPDRITWDDIADMLNKRGWMEGTATAIKQAFGKERRRRKLNEGE